MVAGVLYRTRATVHECNEHVKGRVFEPEHGVVAKTLARDASNQLWCGAHRPNQSTE